MDEKPREEFSFLIIFYWRNATRFNFALEFDCKGLIIFRPAKKKSFPEPFFGKIFFFVLGMRIGDILKEGSKLVKS